MVRQVTVLQCALWGIFGGAAVEGLEIGAAIGRNNGRWPWNRRKGPHLFPVLTAVLIRLSVSGGLSVAAGASARLTALGAVGIGVAAPLIIEKLAQQIPVTQTIEVSQLTGRERYLDVRRPANLPPVQGDQSEARDAR